MSNLNKLLETDEFIYLLGYFWADGYLGRVGKCMSMSIQEDDGIEVSHNIRKLNEFLTKPFSIKKSIPKNEKHKSLIRFYSGDKDLCEFLLKYKFLEKSNEPPTDILGVIPQHKHHLFYLGFFDGDGCIYNGEKSYKQYSFSFSGPYSYDWSFLEKVLDSIDVKWRVQRSHRSKGSNSSLISTGMFGVEKFYNYLYSQNIRSLSRKRMKFLEIIEHVKLQTSKTKGVCFSDGKYFAYININKKRILLGSFDSEDEAIKHRKIAESIKSAILSELQTT